MYVEVVLKSGYRSGLFKVNDEDREKLELALQRRGEHLRLTDPLGVERIFKTVDIAAMVIRDDIG